MSKNGTAPTFDMLYWSNGNYPHLCWLKPNYRIRFHVFTLAQSNFRSLRVGQTTASTRCVLPAGSGGAVANDSAAIVFLQTSC